MDCDVQKSLQQNKKFENWRREFNLFTDRVGILRCRGRLLHADLPYSAKHPILLDANHGFTMLAIRKSHESVMHNGVKETLTELRSKFWLARGRCEGITTQLCNMSPTQGKTLLSTKFRVKTAPAFTFTGLDYAGPLYVKGVSKKTEERCGFAYIPAVLQGQFPLT